MENPSFRVRPVVLHVYARLLQIMHTSQLIILQPHCCVLQILMYFFQEHSKNLLVFIHFNTILKCISRLYFNCCEVYLYRVIQRRLLKSNCP